MREVTESERSDVQGWQIGGHGRTPIEQAGKAAALATVLNTGNAVRERALSVEDAGVICTAALEIVIEVGDNLEQRQRLSVGRDGLFPPDSATRPELSFFIAFHNALLEEVKQLLALTKQAKGAAGSTLPADWRAGVASRLTAIVSSAQGALPPVDWWQVTTIDCEGRVVPLYYGLGHMQHDNTPTLVIVKLPKGRKPEMVKSREPRAVH